MESQEMELLVKEIQDYLSGRFTWSQNLLANAALIIFIIKLTADYHLNLIPMIIIIGITSALATLAKMVVNNKTTKTIKRREK